MIVVGVLNHIKHLLPFQADGNPGAGQACRVETDVRSHRYQKAVRLMDGAQAGEGGKIATVKSAVTRCETNRRAAEERGQADCGQGHQ